MAFPSQARLLVRWPLAGPAGDTQAPAVLALAQQLTGAHPEFVRAEAVRSVDNDWLYLYLTLAAGTEPAAALRDAVQAAAQAARVPGTDAPRTTRLVPLQDEAGAAGDRPAPCHYAVELDIAPEHAEDMRRWYSEEHLPALAAVPGTVRARRFADLDGQPASFACYDLTGADTLQSPEWLAVRATDWSSRIRPLFFNVRRTVFERLFVLQPACVD